MWATSATTTHLMPLILLREENRVLQGTSGPGGDTVSERMKIAADAGYEKA